MNCENRDIICRDCPARGMFDSMRSAGLNYQSAIDFARENNCPNFDPKPSLIFSKPGVIVAINVEGSIFPPSSEVK
jgi:hypothetical protein